MQPADSTKDSVILSVEKIIDLIRTVRNELLKDFLNDTMLNSSYEEKFHKPLSNIKREFLKRDLKALMIEPVDLVHYAGLINHIKETGTAALAQKNSEFFYKDIDQIMEKYAV